VPGYAVTSWLGLAGPASIPQPMITRLNAEVTAILAEPETIDRVKRIGGEPKPTTAEAFRGRVSSDIEKWTKVVTDAGIARI
jgi:tripartite-type tricarboxylate transporter receptor subunit TctC